MGDLGLTTGWKDPLEESMATHPSIPTWRIPWTGEPGGLQTWGLKMLDTTEQLCIAQATPYPLPIESSLANVLGRADLSIQLD